MRGMPSSPHETSRTKPVSRSSPRWKTTSVHATGGHRITRSHGHPVREALRFGRPPRYRARGGQATGRLPQTGRLGPSSPCPARLCPPALRRRLPRPDPRRHLSGNRRMAPQPQGFPHVAELHARYREHPLLLRAGAELPARRPADRREPAPQGEGA
jgi:hypothetical protein